MMNTLNFPYVGQRQVCSSKISMTLYSHKKELHQRIANVIHSYSRFSTNW